MQDGKLRIAVAFKEVPATANAYRSGRKRLAQLLRQVWVDEGIIVRKEDLYMTGASRDARQIDARVVDEFIQLWDYAQLLHEAGNDKQPR